MIVETDYPLKNLTSFKIGGNAEKIYFPETNEEFVKLLKNLNEPLVLGSCSNVLISSNGIKGNVISTKNLDKVSINGNLVNAECGIKGPLLSKLTAENSLSGFEFMCGFPGSLGGNLYMNASAHNQAVSDKLLSVELFDFADNSVIKINKNDLEFSYRSSVMQKRRLIVLSAEFELEYKSQEEIQKQIDENLTFRRQHQPSLALPNAGSVFKNPEGNSAGALLDKAGAKDFFYGGAKVWENHANFIINTHKNALSQDVLELMFMMYNAVNEKFGIKLRPEVKCIGEFCEREEEICASLYSQK